MRLRLIVAASMILLHLPPVLRSLHEAAGVGIWLSCFVLAYLARRVNRPAPVIEPDAPIPRRPYVTVRALRPTPPIPQAPHV